MSSPTLTNTTNLAMDLRHHGLLDNNTAAPTTTSGSKPSWWKSATVYQIWPASFNDSTGSGLGDLRGIISKLDYLHSLGVDTVWLSPMYDSPQEDMGYDISDYNAIYPPYGTMEDMDDLIAGLHRRGMKIILDLVVNHTSDQHKWFQESKKSREGKYADWYIWRDGKKGTKDVGGDRPAPPNNWGSVFTGSAWKWVEERQQYYLHLFAEGQPDLNWENEELRREVHEQALRFWLRKGVDGFRIDTCNIYSKDQAALERDGPVRGRAPYGDFDQDVVNGPRIHEFWQEIRREVLDHFGDPLMVGELALSSFEETLKYVGREPRELSMVFDFTYGELGRGSDRPAHELQGYTLPDAKAALQRTQDYVANPLAWTSIFKENHDRPRSVSYHGTTNPKYWEMAAKLLGMMTATLSGTLFLYQGEEIGMTNVPFTWKPEDFKDIASINYWKTLKETYGDDKEKLAEAWKGLVTIARDNARTPVQWTGEKNAGFTTGTPWMRVNENYQEGINAAEEEKRADSVLAFWKQLLQVRKAHKDVFVFGRYQVRDFDNKQTWTFEKAGDDGTKAWVILNFSESEAEYQVPAWASKLLLSNSSKPGKTLQPFEGRIYV